MKWTRPLLFSAAGLLSVLAAGGGTLTAVPLPNPQVPGFTFPESEATILGWTYDLGNNTPGAPAAFTNLNVHGWGLWTALTMQTAQVDDGERLRVFETWYSPQEVDQIPAQSKVGALPLLRRQRSVLRNFVQFEHGLEPTERPSMPANTGNETVFGYVKFDPTAAAHVVAQNPPERCDAQPADAGRRAADPRVPEHLPHAEVGVSDHHAPDAGGRTILPAQRVDGASPDAPGLGSSPSGQASPGSTSTGVEAGPARWTWWASRTGAPARRRPRIRSPA